MQLWLAPPYTPNPKTLDTPPNSLYRKTMDVQPFKLGLKGLDTGCCTLQLDLPETPKPLRQYMQHNTG